MDCTQCWLGELGEADGTIRKSHVSAQKQFLTKSIDYYREPFGRFIREVPRRTAFYGSVNPKNYLSDETGNRRYWSITATYINHEHGIDMQQVWAEFKVLLDSGESYRLSEEEHTLLNNSNKEFELLDPLEDKIKTSFDFEGLGRKYQTCTQILNNMGYDKPSRYELNKISSIIIELGFTRGCGRNRRSFNFPYPWFDKIGDQP
jgi:putative DNA primase/helicase